MRRTMTLLSAVLVAAAACNPRARWLFQGEPKAYGAPDGVESWAYMGGRIYEGDFEDGVPHGQGSLTWPDAREHRGTFVQGRMEGAGMLFEGGVGRGGTFVDGVLQQGPGARVESDGRMVVGTYAWWQDENGAWRDDRLTGPGTLVVDDRVVFSGAFEDGAPHGTGWGLLPDGADYLGSWEDGQPDGDEGICTRDGVAERCHYVDGVDRTAEREVALEEARHAAVLAEIEDAREARLAPTREDVREVEGERASVEALMGAYEKEHALQLSLAPQSECDYAAAMRPAQQKALRSDSCVYTLNPELEAQCYCRFSFCLSAEDPTAPPLSDEEAALLSGAKLQRARSCWGLLELMARGEDPRAALAGLQQEADGLSRALRRLRAELEREEAAARRAADAAIARAESARAAETEKARRAAEEAMRERLETYEETCPPGGQDCGCRPAAVIATCKNLGRDDFPSTRAYTEAGCGCVNPI